MSDYGLKGKGVVVTGGTQGIGFATAKVFSGYGAKLFLLDFKNAEQSVKKLRDRGVEAGWAYCDVSNEESVREGFAAAEQFLGEIHVLINCAGIGYASILKDLSMEEWRNVMAVNGDSVFMMTKEAANHMIAKGIEGNIINVSSQAAKLPEYGNGVYCCSKAVVSALAQVFALELAEYGIRVNAVCPGYTDTDNMQQVFLDRGPIEGMTPEQYEAHLMRNVPLGRMALPEEVGEFIAFLASNKATYITGVAHTIAGGSTLI